jgi:hypothetical protein
MNACRNGRIGEAHTHGVGFLMQPVGENFHLPGVDHTATGIVLMGVVLLSRVAAATPVSVRQSLLTLIKSPSTHAIK